MEADQQGCLELHQRLLAGDRMASEALVHSLLEPINAETRSEYPHTDPHLVREGVTDALLDYAERPAMFDPAKRVPLDRFLAHAAWCNVRDLLRSEKRRKVREEKSTLLFGEELVALPDSAANSEESRVQEARDQTSQLMDLLDNPTDRQVFALQLAGERRTVEFAKVLGLQELPAAEQRKEVKRAKDRIRVQLKRQKERP